MSYELVTSACGLAVWGWFFTRGRSALPREAHRPVPWRGADVLLLALFYVAALGGCYFLMTHLAGQSTGEDARLPVSFQVAAMALANGLTVALVILVAARYGRPGLPALGLRREPIPEQVVLGLLGFFAVLPLLAGFGYVLVRLAPLLRYEIERQDVVNVFISGPRTPGYVWMVLYAVIGAPLAEEILFRGFVQGYLRRLFPPAGAIVLSALLFAFFHQPVHAAIAVFLLGLILGYQRERTRSLLAPIITHILFNLHTFITTQIMRP